VTRTRLIRLAGLAAGAAIIAGGLAGVTVAQQSETALAAGDLASNVLVLVLAGLVIATLAWVLADDRNAGDDEDARAGVTTNCRVCGGVINADWRLCPHCGERLGTFRTTATRR